MSAIQLQVAREGLLKPHSWLLHVSQRPKLWCGDNVEVKGDTFFEGAYAGEFGEFSFHKCADVFGTGGALTSSGWLLVPPSHTLEAVYVLRLKDADWIASNSIAFLKQHADFEFLVSDRKLIRSFIGIVNGIEHSPARIRTSRGELYVLHHHNAVLEGGVLKVRPKPLPPRFADFAAYRDYLAGVVRSVAINAASAERRARFDLLTTISSGYDSPACAVLARAAGCGEAITFVEARGGGSDDGTEIANSLNLRVKQFLRPETGGANEECAADFFATGMQAEDIVYEPLHGTLAGRILVTGFHGDKVWDKVGKASPTIKRGDVSGSSLGEFRLSESFVHLPVPFIGALRHADILKIANSPEMDPFSIGGSYDRPIPRRLVEEAGIRRDAFGQSKKAISTLVFADRSLLAAPIREKVVRCQISNLGLRERLRYRMMAALVSGYFFVLSLLDRSGGLLPIGRGLYRKIVFRIFGRSWNVVEHSHPFNAQAFKWALSTVSKKYAVSGN